MAQNSRRPLRLALVTALTVSLALVAQAPVGSLWLEVRDSSGAAVAAGGLLESLTTGFRRSFQCDERGVYTVSGLPIGRYRLRIAKDGFTTYTEAIEISSASPFVCSGIPKASTIRKGKC